jgi:hypothetical protein
MLHLGLSKPAAISRSLRFSHLEVIPATDNGYASPRPFLVVLFESLPPCCSSSEDIFCGSLYHVSA